GVSFLRNNAPDSSITVVTFSVSPDGTEVDLQIAIAPSAPVGARVIQITIGAVSSTPAGTGGNLFTVQSELQDRIREDVTRVGGARCAGSSSLVSAFWRRGWRRAAISPGVRRSTAEAPAPISLSVQTAPRP